MLQREVDGAALAPHGLGDLGRAHAPLPQLDDARAVEQDLAALVDTLGLGGLDAGALPVLNEAELGDPYGPPRPLTGS